MNMLVVIVKERSDNKRKHDKEHGVSPGMTTALGLFIISFILMVISNKEVINMFDYVNSR